MNVPPTKEAENFNENKREVKLQKKLEKMERKRDEMKCWTLQEKIDLQVDVARMSVYDKQLVELRRIMSSDAKCPVRDDCIDTIDLKDFTLDQLRLYVESRRINPSSTSSGSDSLMPLEKQAVQAPPDTCPNLLENIKEITNGCRGRD
ncbi:Hypothetical predicted protein [Cloeon dipterum]|uniref:Uncharacterized protein n=1 Tax=Cloeon dipterum TaxID=197152 RepID=A0A8S1E811_9INSE|nr:Hypothetical predicted protein [Cloeon dipterum]